MYNIVWNSVWYRAFMNVERINRLVGEFLDWIFEFLEVEFKFIILVKCILRLEDWLFYLIEDFLKLRVKMKVKKFKRI